MTRPTAPTITKIANYWSQRETPWGQYVDVDSPQCFACGFFRDSDHTTSHWNTWVNAGKNGLERAHVIPHSLGGSSDVDNFVLLCKKCHIAAPNTGDASFMFNWMQEREKSFFSFDAVTIKEIQMLVSKLSQIFDSEIQQRFEKLCKIKRQRITNLAVERLNGVSNHFSHGINVATLSVIYQKVFALLDCSDSDALFIENSVCDCDRCIGGAD